MTDLLDLYHATGVCPSLADKFRLAETASDVLGMRQAVVARGEALTAEEAAAADARLRVLAGGVA